MAALDRDLGLPTAARREWRPRPAPNEAARQRWDTRMRRQSGSLEEGADVFRDLVHEAPEDLPARFNQTLFLAWLGRNRDALSVLETYVELAANLEPDLAADAWTLAEVLRAGAGAEDLADDLSHAIRVEINQPEMASPDPSWHLRAVSLDPIGTAPQAHAFEWLDRPMPKAHGSLKARDLPRVLAVLVIAPGSWRLSSPDPSSLANAQALLGPGRASIERTVTPLPLRLLDAGLWTFRLPLGLSDDVRARLVREALEHRLEHIWVHWPRHGLDGRSPLEAGSAAVAGDAVASVKLEGVLQMREQLAQRATAVALQGAYPFERLRRRLGITPRREEEVDPADVSCMGLTALRNLDLGKLEESTLAEAAHSAAGLRNDALTARITAAWLDRGPRPHAHHDVDPTDAIAALVRDSLSQGLPDPALDWLAKAGRADPDHREAYETWSAEVLARVGRPVEAFQAYEDILKRFPETGRALQAAEDLAGAGHTDLAASLAERARELAATAQERARAEGLLATLRDGHFT